MSKHQIILGINTSKLNFLADADNSLDQKAGSLLGFVVALIVGYSSLVLPHLEDFRKIQEGWLGITSLAISSVFLIAIVWPREYHTFVNVLKHKEYLKKIENDLLRQLISDTCRDFGANREKLKQKSLFYKISILLIVLASFLLFLSAIPLIYL